MKQIRLFPDLDELAAANGFNNSQELNRLVARIPLETPEQQAVFQEWQRHDGSKAGLAHLLTKMAAPQNTNGAAAAPPGLRQQLDMIDEALEVHNGIAVFGLFSGGHDSLVASHIASHHPLFRGVIHLNTTTGLRECFEFVGQTCEEQGWPLLTQKPFLPYESYLVHFGFPGPPMHSLMYSRLKDRPLRALLKNIKKNLGAGRGERIVLVSGVRKQESNRRAEIQDRPHVEDSRVWTPVISDFSASDCAYYMQHHGLKRSPVKDRIHLSGECFCGAFARDGEYHELDFWYPYQAERIRRWQRLVQVAQENQLWELGNGLRDPDDVIDRQYCRWGPKSGIPQEQMAFPMCHFCRGLGNGQNDVSGVNHE